MPLIFLDVNEEILFVIHLLSVDKSLHYLFFFLHFCMALFTVDID